MKRQKAITTRATDDVFVTQHSKIGRYYTENESKIIINKVNE